MKSNDAGQDIEPARDKTAGNRTLDMEWPTVVPATGRRQFVPLYRGLSQMQIKKLVGSWCLV